MSVIRLGPFLGANVALRPKLLPNNVGVLSVNHRPDRGDLRPWKAPLTVKAIGASIKTISLLPRDATTDVLYWFVWTTIVHAIRGFRASDSTKRTYYSGSGPPKVTDNLIGLAGEPYPTAYRDLGVPRPINQMTVTQTAAGTGADETRFYAYSYLTDWDEQGPANVGLAITCKPGATFDITNMSLAPTGFGETRGINRIRIYRTLTGDAGSAFYFLRDIAVAATSTDPALAPGTDVLPSALYAMPPTDLKNLIPLWNGIAAGISGNSVRYCELNKLHAWPVAYETLCHDTPIALAVFQKTLLIVTTGRPRTVTGSLPEAMDDDPVEFIAPCVSAQSLVAFGHGACWASADGLAYVGTNGAPRILTAGIIAPEEWAAMNPHTMIAGQYRGAYFCFYDSGAGVLKGFMLDPMAPEAGLFNLSEGYSAIHFDPLSGQLYVLDGTNIKQWNAGAANMTASFESKTYRMPAPMNMACAEVIADAYPLTFTLYADARSPWVKSVTSKSVFNLPSGYTADDYRVRVDTDKDITGLVIAETLDEIAQT